MADSPDKKNVVSGQQIIEMYNGKTRLWTDDDTMVGGAYMGGGGKFEGRWKNSVGIGKWYATSQCSLCYEAKWKRSVEEAATDIKRCWKHVTDSDGVLWKQDPQTNDWYRPAKEFAERVRPGNKIAKDVRKLRQLCSF